LNKIILCLSLFISSVSFSQTVINVKNGKVLLDLGSLNVNSGDRVVTSNSEGKKKALLQIRQIKNGKATAEIVKGTPEAGHSFAMFKGAAKRPRQAVSKVEDYSQYATRKRGGYGFTGSLAMNAMKISNLTRNGTSYSFEMTGTNFGLGGFYDYSLNNSWLVRAHGTLEMFDVKATSGGCGTTADLPECTVKFTQLGGYGTFNYIFSPQPYRAWAGVGGGLFIYLSKDASVLDTNKFFFNSMLMAAGGVDYFLNQTTFVPISLEYQMIPDKEAGVTSIVLRAGWGKSF
jgi:hypothetical protein